LFFADDPGQIGNTGLAVNNWSGHTDTGVYSAQAEACFCRSGEKFRDNALEVRIPGILELDLKQGLPRPPVFRENPHLCFCPAYIAG
jgi:hypothetical protein